ncbi:MAG TPA: hypothetical protein DDW94_07580 [Deltaproteobacteria bacterium]|nr:MAG: hypothetical protein A2Z79_02110 [Deltaproteobacteria bacterium GWA2_55_82]OGQ62621.1 MAG: hypothetical protein A3I81_08925 [Deltaproteobacteria bacterium RIFCSPLOWO2_02_FULL_55_12]OIJ74211.1 MAG: hypothetical protein A2V21_308010 [Deltaproteobacteria bacterium GWC2_55_46]HBG46834.1 hypothetical protein [Deltaproteobacteria bacterium]HCY11108.1 hypothetical protein [Deltaproteobacteria bacterium]
MIRRNLAYTSAGEAASKAIIFVLFVYLAKKLGPLDYGYFSLAVTFYLMGRTISLNSLDMHGIRLISSLRDDAGIRSVLSDINMLRALFSIVVCVTLTAAIFFLYEERAVRWITIGFTLCLIPATFISEWFFNGRQLMFYSALSQVGSWTSFMALVLLAPRLSETYSYYLPAAFFASLALMAVAMHIVMRKLVGGFTYRFSLKEASSIFMETGYINLVNIFGYLINSAGILVLSFSNSPDLGYYAVALQICTMLILGGSVIYRVTLPHLNTVWRESESEFNGKVGFVTRLLGFAAIVAVFYLLAYSEPFIRAFWGAEYLRVAPVVKVLSVIIFFGYYMMGFAQGLFILGKDRLLMKIYLFQLALTLALTAGMFRYFGLMGVAAALSISYFVGFIVFMASFHRSGNYEWRHALKVMVSGGLLITFLYWAFDGNIPFAFILIFPAVYFAACVLLKVMSLADLKMIFPGRPLTLGK